jgi:hypothetical protein
LRSPRRPFVTLVTITAALGVVAAAGAFVVGVVRDRAAVRSVAGAFARPEFAALPTEHLARLGDAAGWSAHDLRTFGFVSEVLSTDGLAGDAAEVRSQVNGSLLRGDFEAALAAVRAVETEFDTRLRSEALGTR